MKSHVFTEFKIFKFDLDLDMSFNTGFKFLFLFLLIVSLTFILWNTWNNILIVQFPHVLSNKLLGTTIWDNDSKTTTTNQLLETTTLNNLRCSPLSTTSLQDYFIIDGVKYPHSVSLFENASINFTCLDESKKKPVILFYTPWFGNWDWHLGHGYRTFLKKLGCPVTSCETTSNKSRLNESDLVLTHMGNGHDMDKIGDFPKFRSKNQRWVFMNYVK